MSLTMPPAVQDADELFDAFKCIETLLIQRRSQMAAWSSLSAVASTTTTEASAAAGQVSCSPPGVCVFSEPSSAPLNDCLAHRLHRVHRTRQQPVDTWHRHCCRSCDATPCGIHSLTARHKEFCFPWCRRVRQRAVRPVHRQAMTQLPPRAAERSLPRVQGASSRPCAPSCQTLRTPSAHRWAATLHLPTQLLLPLCTQSKARTVHSDNRHVAHGCFRRDSSGQDLDEHNRSRDALHVRGAARRCEPSIM